MPGLMDMYFSISILLDDDLSQNMCIVQCVRGFDLLDSFFCCVLTGKAIGQDVVYSRCIVAHLNSF